MASVASQVFYSSKPDTLPHLPLFCLLDKYKEHSVCIIKRSLSEFVDISSAFGSTFVRGSGLVGDAPLADKGNTDVGSN